MIFHRKNFVELFQCLNIMFILAIRFGIALPKWMIKKENTVIVVGIYALVFMLILPVVVVSYFAKANASNSPAIIYFFGSGIMVV